MNKHIGSSFDKHVKDKMNDPVFAELFNREKVKFEISQMVINYRKKSGLTQEQLANLTGLKQAAIARIESRSSKMIPSIEILKKIFMSLGYDLSLHLKSFKKAA